MSKAETKAKRDVTRALEIVNGIWFDDECDCWAVEIAERDELLRILTDMDARSGRRDPSKRTARKKR